jgi:ferrous iron transport protein B
VSISKGKGRIDGKEYEIIDTPGMYSLLPITEEERVSQSYLFDNDPFVYVHVVDAKNIQRMLSLTLCHVLTLVLVKYSAVLYVSIYSVL